MAVAVDRRIGPDFHHGAVRPDTGQRERRHHIDIGRKTRGGRPGAAGKHPLGGVESLDRDAITLQIRSSGQAPGRLAGGHAHRPDLTLRRGGDRIETQKGAGGHDDLTPLRLCQVDQVGPLQERTGAEHHHALAGLQHGPADALDRSRNARLQGRPGNARHNPAYDRRQPIPQPRLEQKHESEQDQQRAEEDAAHHAIIYGSPALRQPGQLP